MATDRWLDVPALAEVLGVSTAWVYGECTARRIPFHKVGRKFRFTPADVAAIERATAMPPADPRRLRSTA